MIQLTLKPTKSQVFSTTRTSKFQMTQRWTKLLKFQIHLCVNRVAVWVNCNNSRVNKVCDRPNELSCIRQVSRPLSSSAATVCLPPSGESRGQVVCYSVAAQKEKERREAEKKFENVGLLGAASLTTRTSAAVRTCQRPLHQFQFPQTFFFFLCSSDWPLPPTFRLSDGKSIIQDVNLHFLSIKPDRRWRSIQLHFERCHKTEIECRRIN